MKKLLLILALVCAAPILTTSCQTPPNERVVVVQTLKATGETAEAAVALSAQLYRDGKINAPQARQVMTFYDTRFQPAFRFAVLAAQGDLSSVASPDLASLAYELVTLVASFQKSPQ